MGARRGGRSCSPTAPTPHGPASALLMPLTFFMAPNDPRHAGHGGRDPVAGHQGRLWPADEDWSTATTPEEAAPGRAAGRGGDVQYVQLLAG